MNYPMIVNEKREQLFRVINAILDGASLRSAVKAEGLDIHTFADRLQTDKEAAQRYARSQELRGDVLADDIIAIADSDEDPAKARNQITARQWLAGKLNKRYGDRIDLNVTATLDISSTLSEARARMLSVRDQHMVQESQPVDYVDVVACPATDEQSIARVIDKPIGDQAPDIFS